jgi:hypothetical protein
MEINWNPSIRQLRSFGCMSFIALPLAAGLWTHGSITAITLAASAGTAFATASLLRPRLLRPLVVALNVLTWPLVLFVNELVLIVAFCGVIVPVGILFRLFRRDALQLKIDRNAASYWQPKKQPADARSYFRRW